MLDFFVCGSACDDSLSAVFWVVWSLLRFVSEMMGDQRVFPYSMTGRVMVLYVVISVSFCLPQVVEVSALSTLSDFSALSLVILVCSVKLSFGSSVTPSILGFLTVGMRVLLILRFSVLLYSAGFGVKRVAVDLSGFRMRSFSFVQE